MLSFGWFRSSLCSACSNTKSRFLLSLQVGIRVVSNGVQEWLYNPISDVPKQSFKGFSAFANNSKRVLQCPSKVIQFPYHSLHRERVGKEKKLPRTLHVSVLDDIQLSDCLDLANRTDEFTNT